MVSLHAPHTLSVASCVQPIVNTRCTQPLRRWRPARILGLAAKAVGDVGPAQTGPPGWVLQGPFPQRGFPAGPAFRRLAEGAGRTGTGTRAGMGHAHRLRRIRVSEKRDPGGHKPCADCPRLVTASDKGPDRAWAMPLPRMPDPRAPRLFSRLTPHRGRPGTRSPRREKRRRDLPGGLTPCPKTRQGTLQGAPRRPGGRKGRPPAPALGDVIDSRTRSRGGTTVPCVRRSSRQPFTHGIGADKRGSRTNTEPHPPQRARDVHGDCRFSIPER